MSKYDENGVSEHLAIETLKKHFLRDGSPN